MVLGTARSSPRVSTACVKRWLWLRASEGETNSGCVRGEEVIAGQCPAVDQERDVDDQADQRTAAGRAEMPGKRRQQHHVVREEPSQLPDSVAPVRVQSAVDEVGCRTQEGQAEHDRGLPAELPRKDAGVEQQSDPGSDQDYGEGGE